MLRTELIDLINKRKVWAFVGSGASIDAGCPGWAQLVTNVVEYSDEKIRGEILNDSIYNKAFGDEKYPTCFSRIQHFAGRDALEKWLKNEIVRAQTPGEITKRLVDWPFAGYITVNYDSLLEIALRTLKQRSWVPVGNSRKEISKVSGDVSNVVWHVHGSINMSADKSRLIITEQDYDDVYLENSAILTQLRGLLSHHRLVFLGFGFKDPEVMRLLKQIGRLANPAQTIFAFLPRKKQVMQTADRRELLEKYNVDVIPYDVLDHSHGQLTDLLGVYGAMILRRSQKFGEPERECPSYDPETTGLLIYNQLTLKNGSTITGDILGVLLKVRILALLMHRKQCTLTDLIDDLEARIKAIRGQKDSKHEADILIKEVLLELSDNKLVETKATTIQLTEKGRKMVADNGAQSELLSQQFSASLAARAEELVPNQKDSSDRIARVAETFLKDCVEKRALGVAQTTYAWRNEIQSYHMVALLQELPEFMEQLKSYDEAIMLTKVIRGVLSDPSQIETQYIGVAIQARFGVHILGYDPNTLKARINDLSNTLFLIDSSTLIPYLAKSSIAYTSARILMDRLKESNSYLATTSLLSIEVAEHAGWVLREIDTSSGKLGIKSLIAATGKSGARINAFLQGFIEEIAKGKTVLDFLQYFRKICDFPRTQNTCSSKDVQRIFDKGGIRTYEFQQWEGFDNRYFHERDELKKKIADLRKTKGNYKHDRQVRAEAEALIVIRNLRDGIFTIDKKKPSNAYFISYTRAIDYIDDSKLPITMRPEALLQWLATIKPCTLEELSTFTNRLLYELFERGLSIVDKEKICNVFGPFIDASKKKLVEELEHHKTLIAQKYGESSLKAFSTIDVLDHPIVLESLSVQKAEQLAKELEEEREIRKQTQLYVKISEKQRAELARLREKESIRKQKAQKKKRAIASRRGKKKKKHKKKNR